MLLFATSLGQMKIVVSWIHISARGPSILPKESRGCPQSRMKMELRLYRSQLIPWT